MQTVTRHYAQSPYGQLHFRMAGVTQAATRPPLLLIHSTPSTGAMWEPVMAPLAADRVVLAPDTVGYGMSDPPAEAVGIEAFAQAMLGFMDEMAAKGVVAPGPFDVAGFHTGSITATELAHAFPTRVRRLALFGLAAYDAEARAAKLEKVRETFPLPDDTLAHVEKLWAIQSRLADPRLDTDFRHRALADSLRTVSRLPWGFMAVYRYDFLKAMTEVTQPVLVMNPEDDLWDLSRQHSHLFPNGRRHDMPGVRHGVLKLETAAVVAALRDFLDN